MKSRRPVNSDVGLLLGTNEVSVMDKGDRIAVIVGLVVLGVLVIGALLTVAGAWAIGQGERTVLGSRHSSPVASSSPSASPSAAPSPDRRDRLR